MVLRLGVRDGKASSWSRVDVSRITCLGAICRSIAQGRADREISQPFLGGREHSAGPALQVNRAELAGVGCSAVSMKTSNRMHACIHSDLMRRLGGVVPYSKLY